VVAKYTIVQVFFILKSLLMMMMNKIMAVGLPVSKIVRGQRDQITIK